MASTDPTAEDYSYDEFAYLHENCEEYDLEYGENPPVVCRGEHEVGPGRCVRFLKWGSDSPEIVFLHGGAQNAHTWDTVALALRPHPLLAIDLPGHGQSDWRDDKRYNPRSHAEDVAAVIAAHAPENELLVGMSLGGLTANAIAAHHPHLVRRLLVVDVTPGVNHDKAKEVTDFIAGPQTFASFGEIFDRTVQFNPTRTASSLRRGIIHNARRLADGSWEWRYDRTGFATLDSPTFDDLWEDISRIDVPYFLVRGGLSPVVDDADVEELRRRQPEAQYVVVDESGHSVQGDQPLALARIIEEYLAR
ncbi:MAG: 2-(acetamidomethylene)succinate hydrolase [Acidimicrobiales bacterium]|nr:MAG: alpha/beta hydrolase [Actinomycetota bacterium]MBV6509940.1 2-(acetamidomethylene)succinate hydrolase [Acidimicrobiales bacterium]RIK08570.1 MAG: alpha/beta hydrolase [Acidobacteriota bacterium]